MKRILFVGLFSVVAMNVFTQITVSAGSESGSGYESITGAGLDFESPDCVHADFGPHITQKYDEFLDRNVFAFHSHIVEDNDRCQVFDRVRMEIKGGPNTNLESQHTLGSESYYRWKFKIPEDFKGSSSFCHIFQNKIKGGDDGFPVITITPRASKLEVIHNGGDSGADLGDLVVVDLEPFLGKWVEAYVYQLHSENGKILITLKDISTGNELVNYSNDDIDLWRAGAEYSRPKWGIYRKKVDGLKDEIMEFADFCISEIEESFCPSDEIAFGDNEAPSVPLNLEAANVEIDAVDLSWEESTDNFAVTSYLLYQNGDSIWNGTENQYHFSNLVGSTTYSFSVRASDAAGNLSEVSNVVSITTDPINSLPEEPSNPYPKDMSEASSENVTLRWDKGENTDSSLVFFGAQESMTLISSQVEEYFTLQLSSDSSYFWQIGQKNENGITLGPIWSFSTSSESSDDPWIVYRGNERPDIENLLLEPRDIPENPEIDMVFQDPAVPFNNIYHYFEDSEDMFRWRYDFEDSDTSFTVVARIKAFPESNNIAYFEVRLGGVREKLRVNHASFKLEKSSPVVEEEYDFDFDADFHIVRITMLNKVMKVYLDENPIPFAAGYSETADSGSNFEFGKSGGNPTGCFIDWMTILPNYALAPDQGPALPTDLILSNDASLSMIYIGGVALSDFDSNVFSYDISYDGSEDPMVEFNTSSELATFEIDTVVGTEFIKFSINVIAQDSFTKKTYDLNFLKLSSDLDFNIGSIKISPNPVFGNLLIEAKDLQLGSLKIYDSQANQVFSKAISNREELDLSSFSNGIYFLVLESKSGKISVRKLILQK